MKKISIIIFAFLISACSFHTGNISSGAHIDCPMIYIASGSANTIKFLGIGGIDKDALIVEAKYELYRNFPYKKEIKLSNFSVDYKNSYFFIFATTKVTVSADVFDCNLTDNRNSIPSLDSFVKRNSFLINGFKVGDSIIYLFLNDDHEIKINKATVVSFAKKDKVFIKTTGWKKPFKKRIKYIYKATPDAENIYNFGFNVGDVVEATFLKDESEIKFNKKCVIKGINKEKVVLEYINSKYIVSTYVTEKQFIRKCDN